MGSTIGHIILAVSHLGKSTLFYDPLMKALGFKVGLDKMNRLVSKTKVKVTVPPGFYPEYSKKYYAFYFRDPDGIPLEVASY